MPKLPTAVYPLVLLLIDARSENGLTLFPARFSSVQSPWKRWWNA
jgi:hypothetical protein